jgi:hypothetical protein
MGNFEKLDESIRCRQEALELSLHLTPTGLGG